MFVVLFFAKVSSIKYVRWNKSNFFDPESPLYALWDKNSAIKLIDYAVGQTSPHPPSSCPHTFFIGGIEFEMSTILFVLLYIRYKDT